MIVKLFMVYEKLYAVKDNEKIIFYSVNVIEVEEFYKKCKNKNFYISEVDSNDIYEQQNQKINNL